MYTSWHSSFCRRAHWRQPETALHTRMVVAFHRVQSLAATGANISLKLEIWIKQSSRRTQLCRSCTPGYPCQNGWFYVEEHQGVIAWGPKNLPKSFHSSAHLSSLQIANFPRGQVGKWELLFPEAGSCPLLLLSIPSSYFFVALV